jgi:hypothetical protein
MRQNLYEIFTYPKWNLTGVWYVIDSRKHCCEINVRRVRNERQIGG